MKMGTLLTRCVFGLSVIVATSAARALYVNETWSGSTDPAGWSIHTYNGGGHTTPGTELTGATADAYRYSTADHMQMTTPATYQRTTAIYTAQTFNTASSFSFTCDYYIGGGTGADGLAFFWLDKDFIDDNTLDVGTISGGYGEWIGVPHGNNPTDSVGYYANIAGYSFEFDHYNNSGEGSFQEYTHFVDTSTWDHAPAVAAADYGSDSDFYYNNGWQRVSFEFDADAQTFSYYLEILDGSGEPTGTTTSVTNFTVAELGPSWYETFDQAYFGIGASTGGAYAEHSIRNLTVVPEPTSALLLALATGAALGRRRRRRAA